MQSRLLVIILAMILISLGFAGLFLPGLQGMALLIGGLILLGQAIPAVRRWQLRLEHRSPRFARLTARFRAPDGSVNLPRLLLTIIIASAVWALVVSGLYAVFSQQR